MKRFLTAVAATVFGAAAQAQDGAPAPAEAYARLPAAEFMSLSPDGSHLAYVSHVEGNRLGVVRNIETGQERGLGIEGYRTLGLMWTSNDSLLLRVDQVARPFFTRGEIDFGVAYSVDVETMRGRVLLSRPSIRQGSRAIALYPDTARLVGFERETGDLLMAMVSEGGQYSLYSVDPVDGAIRRRTRGTNESSYWVADGRGERFAEFSYSSRSDEYAITLHEERGSRQVTEATESLISLSVAGFSSDGDALLLTRAPSGAADTRMLQELPLDSGALGDVVFQDQDYDFDSIMRDPHTWDIIGVNIERERAETIWFDEELAGIQTELEGAFGDAAQITLQSWSQDRSRFIVRAEPPNQGPVYYLFDTARASVDPVRAAYPELLAVPQPNRTSFSFQARDGVTIPAYLTLPDGDGPHPFVALVHGGPASRDYGGFDYFAHFLASRGYGVIQPNFRGSDGYGGAWERAGYGEWGRGLMQTDVLDAVAAVKAQGLASSACIAGLSYGGYAALAGAAFTPDTFVCAISVNGLASMRRHVRYIDERLGPDSQAARYWRLSMTGAMSGEMLDQVDAERSPVEHARAVQIPVLLVHGDDDTVVEARQSRLMADALRQAGAPVEYVELNGGDHWLLQYETRLRVLQEMERFLATHLATQ